MKQNAGGMEQNRYHAYGIYQNILLKTPDLHPALNYYSPTDFIYFLIFLKTIALDDYKFC